MTTQNMTTLNNFLGAFMAGNLEGAVAANIHPDFVATIPASLPWGGVRNGREGCLSLLTDLAALIDVTPGEGEMLSLENPEANTICLVFSVDYTSRANGKVYPNRLAEFYGFTDGLISSVTVFFKDTHALITELDL